MSLYLIDKLLNQARDATNDDVKKIASNLQDALKTSDKTTDSLSLLRQLFFVLQATIGLSKNIDEALIQSLVAHVDVKDKNKLKEGLLCLRIVQELLPLKNEDTSVLKPILQLPPNYLHLQINECNTDECLGNLCALALRNIQSADTDYDVQRKALTYLTDVCKEKEKFIWSDLVQITNNKMGFWLKEVGLYQAANPYTSNPFRKDQNNLVQEVDGTPSTNFFTALSIGQYYTPEQQINIFSFSVLYQWLHHSHAAISSQPELSIKDHQMTESFKQLSGALTPASTPTKQLAKRSPSSPSTTRPSPQVRQSPQRALSIGSRQSTPTHSLMERSATPRDGTKSDKQSVTENMYDSLIRRTFDYCLRILDQSDRKAKVATDTELQNACVIESVKLLDLSCQIDESQVSKAFMELKRLLGQIATDQSSYGQRLYINIVQFLLNHCSAVAYDPHEELNTLFHKILSRSYNSHAVGFDIIMFTLDNLEYLCQECNILSTFFPNIFKLIAWNPHTYVGEFTEIIPAIMSETTSLEVFHAILDLPCMTVALEVAEKMKNVDLTTLNVVTSQQEPNNSVEAFKNAMYRPMFNFFTRGEGGHGDTINRLDKFHAALGDMIEHPRVLVCYQAAPVLLRVWFNEMLEEASLELVSELIPVLLERTSMVYGIPEYQKDVKRIITTSSTLLLKKFPSVILAHRIEITDFLSNVRNIGGWEDFFCLMVFSVGEYISTVYGECTADMVQHVYETLEVLTYEVISITSNTPPKEAPYTLKVVSSLISALSKLATRCQDLIPRAILCLTKVINQHHKSTVLDTDQKDMLISRAQELLNILRIPNFASVVLNPSPDIEAIQVHRDRTSLTSVIRTTHKLLSNTA